MGFLLLLFLKLLLQAVFGVGVMENGWSSGVVSVHLEGELWVLHMAGSPKEALPELLWVGGELRRSLLLSVGVSAPSAGQECFTHSLGLCLALRNSFRISHRFCSLVSKALSAQKLP